jgi:hypothetical protein
LLALLEAAGAVVSLYVQSTAAVLVPDVDVLVDVVVVDAEEELPLPQAMIVPVTASSKRDINPTR